MIPGNQPPPIYRQFPPEREPGNPVVSLVLGILGLCAWIIPLFGLPITIVGLIFGINALKRVQKGMAIAGVVLSIIGLALSGLNAAWGAYLGATGQHAIINQMMGKGTH